MVKFYFIERQRSLGYCIGTEPLKKLEQNRSTQVYFHLELPLQAAIILFLKKGWADQNKITLNSFKRLVPVLDIYRPTSCSAHEKNIETKWNFYPAIYLSRPADLKKIISRLYFLPIALPSLIGLTCFCIEQYFPVILSIARYNVVLTFWVCG